jgi:hypothetical protein
MRRARRPVLALLALAALVGGVLGGCRCVTTPAATTTHGCCEGDGALVLAPAYECCSPDAAADPAIAVFGAHQPGPSVVPFAFRALPAATAHVTSFAGPVPPSAHPPILRI